MNAAERGDLAERLVPKALELTPEPVIVTRWRCPFCHRSRAHKRGHGGARCPLLAQSVRPVLQDMREPRARR
jgi:hypothetical protein